MILSVFFYLANDLDTQILHIPIQNAKDPDNVAFAQFVGLNYHSPPGTLYTRHVLFSENKTK